MATSVRVKYYRLVSELTNSKTVVPLATSPTLRTVTTTETMLLGSELMLSVCIVVDEI